MTGLLVSGFPSGLDCMTVIVFDYRVRYLLLHAVRRVIASQRAIFEAHMLSLPDFQRVHNLSDENSDFSQLYFLQSFLFPAYSGTLLVGLHAVPYMPVSETVPECKASAVPTSRVLHVSSDCFQPSSYPFGIMRARIFSTSSLGSGLSGVAFSNTLRMVGMHGSYIGYMYPSPQVCQSFGVLSGRWYEPAGMGLRMVSRWLVQKCLTLTILPCTPYLTRVSHWSFHQSSHGLPQSG